MRFCCLAALPVLAFARCGVGDGTAETAPPPTIDRIDARLALVPVDSVVLQPSNGGSGSPPDFEMDSTGDLVLADSSNGTVRLFTTDGRLRLILGRQGSGTGEFTDPRFPRFRVDGTLHVADAANAKVTVYSPDGNFLRSVRLRPLTSVSGFIPLADGRYLVTSDDPDGYVLFLFDSAGEVLDRFLPIRGRSPNPAGASSGASRQFWLAERGDSAFVVPSLSDSLWIVRLNNRSASAVAIAAPAYARTALAHDPDSLLRDGSRGIAVGIDAGPAGLVVNFVDPTDGDERSTAIVLTPGGRWIRLERAPLLFHSGPSAFASLSRAPGGSGRLMLRRFRLTVP
jgi:hypothetical protein